MTTKSAYKQRHANFTVSGTHESDFYGFCKGKPYVLYLHLNLSKSPGLINAVTSILPATAVGTSAMILATTPDKKSKTPFSASSRKRKQDDVATAINNFVNSSMQSELAMK